MGSTPRGCWHDAAAALKSPGASGKDVGHGQSAMKVWPRNERASTSPESPQRQSNNMTSGSPPRIKRATSPELSDILDRRRSISEGRSPCENVLSPQSHQLQQQKQQQQQQQHVLENDSASFRRSISSRALRNGS